MYGLVKSMQEMYEWMQYRDNDLIKESLLSHRYNMKSDVLAFIMLLVHPHLALTAYLMGLCRKLQLLGKVQC